MSANVRTTHPATLVFFKMTFKRELSLSCWHHLSGGPPVNSHHPFFHSHLIRSGMSRGLAVCLWTMSLFALNEPGFVMFHDALCLGLLNVHCWESWFFTYGIFYVGVLQMYTIRVLNQWVRITQKNSKADIENSTSVSKMKSPNCHSIVRGEETCKQQRPCLPMKAFEAPNSG